LPARLFEKSKPLIEAKKATKIKIATITTSFKSIPLVFKCFKLKIDRTAKTSTQRSKKITLGISKGIFAQGQKTRGIAKMPRKKTRLKRGIVYSTIHLPQKNSRFFSEEEFLSQGNSKKWQKK